MIRPIAHIYETHRHFDFGACASSESLVKYSLLLERAVLIRNVAQFGSALDWGSRGRWFKSSRPDQKLQGAG